ncbi:type IV pilus assembly protein PilM [Candidatus Falkowbacteria bacterium]|nr:type IV pilus assembly protein PilM [Candidatus Falkowbacteria bacterium]
MGTSRRASKPSSKQLLLGLDIGSSSIKMCQFKQTAKAVELLHFDMVPLPPRAIEDGVLINRAAIVEKIRELISRNKIRAKNCAISVSGHSVIIKKICVPEMPPEELDEAIQSEVEQYLPFDIKDVNVDVQILNPKVGGGFMDVLLVAAKKDVVDDYVSVVKEAGLCPVVVDVDTFAIQNAFWLNYEFPPKEVIALVNVGASTISINVISNGASVYTRDISMGGSLLTEAIMKELDVPWEEAEHYQKMRVDDMPFSGGIFQGVQKCSERVAEALVAEVQHTLDFFEATTLNSDIARIYLLGGMSEMGALSRALERRLEIPVKRINPFYNIVIDSRKFNLDVLDEMMPLATVALGLAMRFKGDAKPGGSDARINLLGSKK